MGGHSIEKIMRRQVRLYERAHADQMELKPLGYKLRQQGLDPSKYYANPRFLLLPWEQSPELEQLDQEQLSVISAAFYACVYSNVAGAETSIAQHNMRLTEALFSRYSDEYMVLFYEASDELDHISCFRAFCQVFLGEESRIWKGEGSIAGADHQYGAYRSLQTILDRHKSEFDETAYGAVYLLHRYLLNLALKQAEGFMCRRLPSDDSDWEFDPIALEINHAHAQDEARHFTTSLELGLELLSRCRPDRAARVRDLVRGFSRFMIADRFGSIRNNVYHRLAVRALREAWCHESFRGLPPVDDVVRRWEASDLEIPERTEYLHSKVWIAQQLQTVIDRAEIDLGTGDQTIDSFLSTLQPAA